MLKILPLKSNLGIKNLHNFYTILHNFRQYKFFCLIFNYKRRFISSSIVYFLNKIFANYFRVYFVSFE